MEQNTSTGLFELQIDHTGSQYLKDAARWAKFLAVLGFIFCGLFVIFALFAGSILGSLAGGFGGGLAYGAGYGVGISIVYILIALLYFFPCLYLFNFASKAQGALRSNDQETLNQSFKNLKSCYRFLGILAIIGIGFWILGIVIVVISAAAGSH